MNRTYTYEEICKIDELRKLGNLRESKYYLEAQNDRYVFGSLCGTKEVSECELFLESHNLNLQDLEYAFRLACASGKLEVAKWLVKVNPDIDITSENNFAYHFADKHGHLDVTQWLMS